MNGRTNAKLKNKETQRIKKKVQMRKVLAIGISILVAAISLNCLGAQFHVAYASPSFSFRVRFPSFVPDSWIQNDYILAVELEIPSVSYYDEKRTDCSRYLSQLPPLEFSIDDSWIGLNAKITIVARWHLDDVIIDINPNPADGRWGPLYKQASALVLSYVIGASPVQGSTDGKDDGYLLDYPHDAHFSYTLETLQDGNVIPEFPAWTLFLAATGISTLTVVSVTRKAKRYLHNVAT